MAEQWLSIVEYARTFAVSDMTIRRRIRTGRIKAVLRDGKYYIPVSVDHATGEPMKQNARMRSAPELNQAQDYHPTPATNYVSSNERPRPVPTVHKAEQQSFQAPNGSREIHNVRPHQHGVRHHQNHHQHFENPKWQEIPREISQPLTQTGQASIEANALLDYCNESLRGIKGIEDAIAAKFAGRLDVLGEQIKTRDLEIKSLRQQVEDLQLLVQILERKKVG